jgi:hypothetical protein
MWHAWERREMYKVLVGKSEGKRPFERPRHRWEYGIRKDLTEISLCVPAPVCVVDSRGLG